ncbi:hypothetical protein B0H17DRAFT_1194167 [Mycena rosella]|uniref:DEAD/DEAH-box helicase domain-containing protein n=1 Tax=Mycena rosella TaxID=1033263 RepID=A0AAD7M6I2_MYCRO|nr:hypothetical protein B0H17DRAFT_1194167 [Mycena rosella]
MTLVPSHIPGVRSPQVPAAPAAAYLVTNQRGRSRASHPECGSANANAAPRPQTALSVVPSFKAFPGASLSEHRTASRTISGPHVLGTLYRISCPHQRVGFQADPREPPSDDTVVYNAADAPPHDESDRACYVHILTSITADIAVRSSPDWRGAFGTPAVKGTFVKWALQVVCRPHIPVPLEEMAQGCPKGVTDCRSASKGLFEGDLIVYTLAAHLTTVGNIPVKYHFDPEESEDVPIPPIDAMILCIQVVRSDHHSHSVLRSSWSAYVELDSDEDNNFILAADVHDHVVSTTTPVFARMRPPILVLVLLLAILCQSTTAFHFYSTEGFALAPKILLVALPDFEPHHYQMDGVCKVLAGIDLIACTPTGSGKTGYLFLAILVMIAIARDPSLCPGVKFPKNPAIIVVCPTNSIEQQMDKNMADMGITALTITADTVAASRQKKEDIWLTAREDLSMLILGPEQLTSRGFRDLYTKQANVQLCAFIVSSIVSIFCESLYSLLPT